MNSVHHDSSFTSSRRPESVYPPSEFSLGHPNNVPGGQLNSIPHENGFREVVSVFEEVNCELFIILSSLQHDSKTVFHTFTV